MAYENLCMYCFEDLQGQTTCPHCGRDSRAAVPQIQMLPGSLVYHDRFLIGRALGQDAAGIVYAAFDTKKENRLRIREYLPRDCAERLNDGAVVPIAGKEDEFEAGIRKLRASVESVEDPRKRHFFFEENGTAYIAQRKSAAAAAAAREDDEGEEEVGGNRRIFVFAGIAVAVLVIAAIVLISLFNGAMSPGRDIAQTPTLDPQQVWIPAVTASPTPYASPTFAALVDPELTWMDYTYGGDVEEEYRLAQRSTPTPAPTRRETTEYTLISTRSTEAEIRELQRKLVSLGWLDSDHISGRYDDATRESVKDFQAYINERYHPEERLSVDGIAGPKTLQWLYEAQPVKPTATPEPRVTPKPEEEDVIQEGSPKKAVRALQRGLITLGLMPEGSDDGVYGATTREAVRRFQVRVNQLQGYEALEVSGTMDALSQAFLRYYLDEWVRLRRATAEPTAVPTPSPVPTEEPTTRPIETPEARIIDEQAPASAVRSVQRLLIQLGMLPAGGDDGIYGSATRSAVADFQQWVNAKRDEQTLNVTGAVDELTYAYLQYCVDHGLLPYGTPTPAPTATPAPTPEPTEAPTPAPTEVPVDPEPENPEETGEIAVGPESPKESIRYVQEMLSAVGLLDENGIDGVYGKGTKKAVKRFQEWVNSIRGEGTLPVTGLVDNDTRLALEYAYDHGMQYESPFGEPTDEPTMPPAPTEEPTEAPTEAPEPTDEPTEAPTEEPEPTEEPTEAPTEAPEVGRIRSLSVAFGDAVAGDGVVTVPEGEFQVRWVADGEAESYAVELLDGDGDPIASRAGIPDTSFRMNTAQMNRGEIYTLRIGALPVNGGEDDVFWREVRFMLPEAADEPTPEPEPEDTPEPTPTVAEVSKPSITIADMAAGEGVVMIEEESFDITWWADGDVEAWYVRVTDDDGKEIVAPHRADDPWLTVRASAMQPGVVYTIMVAALPEGGTQDDLVVSSARFMLPEQITPEPAPTVGDVSAPRISIAGVAAGSSTIVVEDETFQISWSAEGDVETYYVRVVDEDGNPIGETQTTTQTGMSVRASMMRPGEVYTIMVGALPVNGTQDDVLVGRAQFMLPAQATPEPTEEPTPDPTEAPTPAPTVAGIGKPVINVGGSAYQEDGIAYMTDSAIIVSWNADGDVESYTIFVENQDGDRQSLGTTTDTSRTVNAQSLPAGIYTVYVGALPSGGDEDDMLWSSARFGIPAPTPEPTEVPTQAPAPEAEEEDPEPEPTPELDAPIDAESDPQRIQQLQMRLYGLGLLPGDAEPGVLDRKTLEAVAQFQTRANEQFDAGLTVVDPDDPYAAIDVVTLRAIFQAEE